MAISLVSQLSAAARPLANHQRCQLGKLTALILSLPRSLAYPAISAANLSAVSPARQFALQCTNVTRFYAPVMIPRNLASRADFGKQPLLQLSMNCEIVPAPPPPALADNEDPPLPRALIRRYRLWPIARGNRP